MIVTPKGVMLTWREFDVLHEYSCSLPTGTSVGKQWKRRIPYEIRTDPPNEWYLGEYVESSIPGQIGIGVDPNTTTGGSMSTDFKDLCPICNQYGLPILDPESRATAVRCQKCGATVELGRLLDKKEFSK